MTSHTWPYRSVRSIALRLALIATVALLLPALPAAADSGDYQQVVDITFPFTPDVDVRYIDDYDHPRSSSRHHQATDLMVAMGTPVHAAMGGTVQWLSGDEDGPPSYGWILRIAGDDGRSYAYVHLGAQDGPRDGAYATGIERGARVERGQLIGYAGCSGSASCEGGEHLHFEIHDQHVEDPYDYHDHERINPYPSLVAAEARDDYPNGATSGPTSGATSSPAARTPAITFGDVAAGSTHAADIAKLAESGITRGCGERSFCPGQAVTRAQMASFLVRALDLEAAPDHPAFADVDAANVHGADIAALAAAGITVGCGSDNFCPSESVSRQQMASFLVRALDLEPAENADFNDVLLDNVHRRDIDALAAAGITKGCGGQDFCPEAPVTREQMASFLVRALGL